MSERNKHQQRNSGRKEPLTLSAPPLVRDWHRLNALTRIDHLELGKQPDDLDPKIEMVRAVADRFTERVLTDKSATNLAERVRFLNSEDFLQMEIEETLAVGHTPTTEEIEKYKTNLGKTPRGSDKVLINQDLVTSFGLAYPGHFPDVGARLAGRNLPAFMLKSVLFHEFAHAAQSRETFPIDKYTINYSNDTLVFNQYDGTYFTGYLESTPETKFHLNGSGEASTEAIALHASQGAGEYHGQPFYTEGARLISQLNALAHIDDLTYSKFHTGRRPIRELFGRWSRISMPDNTDTVQGRNCLIFIGLAVDNQTTFDNAVSMINQQLVVR